MIDSTRPLTEVRAELADAPAALAAARADGGPARAEVAAASGLPWRPLLPWQVEAARAALAHRASWPPALLIHGRRGIGKHALALHFAQALLCESPLADGLPAGDARAAATPIAGQHPDLLRLELTECDADEGEFIAVDTIAIARIRTLIDFVQITSHRQRGKVAVIAPADRMNAQAANALLKTLEEPPAGTHLILVADQPGRLPATIRSRCRKRRHRNPTRGRRGAWLAAQDVADPAAVLAQAGGAPLDRARARRASAARRAPGWLAALAQPRRARGDRAFGAGGSRREDERRARLARVIDWLLAWTADLARVAAGTAARQNPDFARELDAIAGGWRRSPCFAIMIGYCGSARCLPTPCSRAGGRSRADRLSGDLLGRRFTRPSGSTGGNEMAERKNVGTPPSLAAVGGTARPGVLSLNIRERAALYAAYMPFLRGGGIFIPTPRQYHLGEEVFMLLSLMDDPNRIAVQGKIVWITPEGVQGNRTQGIGVQFTQDETGAAARATIEKILGETLASSRPTHTM